MDMSKYYHGIYAPISKGKMASVVKSDAYAKHIKGRYQHTDIDNDGNDDVLLRDDDTIFVKYHKKTKEHKRASSGRYVYAINSVQQLQSIANQYIQIGDQKFKLYTPDYEVKNFTTKGQSFEDITIWWDNKNYQTKDQPAGYLIKMNNRIDTFFEKEFRLSKMKSLLNKQYVVVLQDDVQYDDKVITLDNNQTAKINDLMTWTIMHTGDYNMLDPTVRIKIPQYERKRKYLQITTLDRQGNQYTINAPRSNQIIAWSERSSDSQWPEIIGQLERVSVHQQITGYLTLEAYVGTHYDFSLLLRDNILLSGVKISDENDKILIEQSLSEQEKKIMVEKLFFTKETTKKYFVEARDVEDNLTKTTIEIQFKKPTIKIDTIIADKKPGQQTFPVKIVAKMSHDIDEGVVNFYSKRKYRNSIPWWMTDYLVNPLQTVVVWWKYLFSNDIGLKNQQGKTVATVDPNNGEITIPNQYRQTHEMKLKYTTAWPTIQIQDKKTHTPIFQVTLPPEQLLDINEGILEKVPLNNEIFGIFNQWWALKKGNTIYMYISKRWDIVVVQDLVGRYEFDPITQSVKYYFASLDKNIPEWYIQVKIKNFVHQLHEW